MKKINILILLLLFLYTLTSINQAQTVNLLSEDFSTCTLGENGTTNNGQSWTGDALFPTVVKAYQAGGAVKLGNASNSGSITSKSLDLSVNSGSFKVSFDVKGWTSVEGDIKVTVTGLTSQTVSYTAIMTNPFENKVLSFTGGTANATVKIETTAKRAFIDNVKIYYESAPIAPTTQASAFLFTGIQLSQMVASWTNGNGSGRIVKINTENNFTDPVSGISPTANSVYAGSGEQVIYNGSGNTVTVTGLAGGTTYYFRAYEYNGTGSSIIYNTATATDNPKSQATLSAGTPNITVGSITGFGNQTVNTISAEKSYSVSGSALTDNISIVPPSGFEVSLGSGTGFIATNPIVLTQSGGTVSSTTVYVRFVPSAVTTYSGNIIQTSTGAAAQNVAVSGTGISVSNPASFSATASGTTQINLTASANAADNNIIVVYNNNGTFSVPTDGAASGNTGDAFAGGTILYKGSAGSLSSHTGLLPNQTVYYKAFSFDASNYYSSGLTANATTAALSAPVSNSAASITNNSFMANWQPVTGAESYRLDVWSNYNNIQLLSENFNLCSAGSIASPDGADISASLNNYLQSNNWTGYSIYQAGGAIKLGTSSKLGYIVTPTIDLSGNSGNATLNFDLQKYGTDATSIQVYHAANGIDFAQVGGDITAPVSFTTQSVNITGGTANSKIKIAAKNTNNYRYYLENLSIGYQQLVYLSNYQDKTVSGTSQVVDGLSAGTTYYYRVRAYCPTSTSTNSSTISLTTADNSQSAPVTAGTNQVVSVPAAGNSGIGEIVFANVTTGDNILVSRFNTIPVSPTGIVGNTSNYRWIIEPGNGLVYNQSEGYTLRFELSQIGNAGIAELADGDNTSISLYKRSTPGSGDFTNVGALTYHRNGTDGNQSDDYLTSGLITSGFSEFAFGSSNNILPVELSSFASTVKNNAVTLSWSTATEKSNYGFNVERSTDKTNWVKIGFVNGNGNSNSPKNYSFTDKSSNSGKMYYRLKQVDTDGKYEYSKTIEADLGLPKTYELSNNYPNPFNPSTTIRFSLPEKQNVKITVFNTLGQKVAEILNGEMEAGVHEINFNASNLTSGIYIYTMNAGKFTQTKKMMLIK